MDEVKVKSRDDFCLENLKLVHYVLSHYMHPKIDDYDDFFQEGCIGLLKAARAFKPELGYRFATFALPTIMNQVRMYMRRNSIIRIPEGIKKIRKQMMEFAGKNNEWELSVSDIVKALKISTYEASEVLNSFKISYLGDPAVIDDDGSNIVLADVIKDDFDIEEDYESKLFETVFCDALDRTINKIGKQRDKDIFMEYIYALMVGDDLSQVYFAEKFNVSRSYISHILMKCKGILKRELKKEK